MISAILATATIALILILSEYLWRKLHIRGEFARKFVHIIAGTFIAFLPFWVSYGWIVFLAVGFIAANLINRYTPLFHAIHAITRKSWGDLLFGFGILGCALLRPNKWLFAGAILQVALADGLAAVVGSQYGKHRYQIFDHVKSRVGTLTFLLSSALILGLVLAGSGTSGDYKLFAVFSIIPLLMAMLENVSGYGSDNIFLPLAFLISLRALHL
ncbi:SEC59/DGK1/VTE5 family protein [soil metagenome]